MLMRFNRTLRLIIVSIIIDYIQISKNVKSLTLHIDFATSKKDICHLSQVYKRTRQFCDDFVTIDLKYTPFFVAVLPFSSLYCIDWFHIANEVFLSGSVSIAEEYANLIRSLILYWNPNHCASSLHRQHCLIRPSLAV